MQINKKKTAFKKNWQKILNTFTGEDMYVTSEYWKDANIINQWGTAALPLE